MIKSIIREIIRPLYMIVFRLNWRRHNKHNDTNAINKFHWKHVSVGRATYGPIEVLYDSGAGRLSIGSYCSIATNVKFFLGGGHNYRNITTYPFQTKIYLGYKNIHRNEKIDIVVGDDVWIGYDSIILAGSRIGKGCVIGARSVVTGDIPPYSVYVANKVIKQRFPKEIIERIEDIDFSTIRHSKGDVYQQFYKTEINEQNVNEIMQAFIKG